MRNSLGCILSPAGDSGMRAALAKEMVGEGMGILRWSVTHCCASELRSEFCVLWS